MTRPVPRPATPADLPALASLLAEAKLPLEGVAEHLDTFVVADDGAGVVASAGLEVYDRDALLRSVAVAPARRGAGLGHTMIEAALDLARARGADTVTLLTTTAAGYFTRFGFDPIDQANAPAAVRRSTQFNGICPASAVAMHLVFKPTQVIS